MSCRTEGCRRPHYARGRCRSCYDRLRKTNPGALAPSTGQGWRGDPAGHAAAGRLGGTTTVARHGGVHMATIGRRGGLAVSADVAHMVTIGRRGGERCAAVHDMQALGRRGGRPKHRESSQA